MRLSFCHIDRADSYNVSKRLPQTRGARSLTPQMILQDERLARKNYGHKPPSGRLHAHHGEIHVTGGLALAAWLGNPDKRFVHLILHVDGFELGTLM